jgi:hypothetical protein
MKLLHNIALWFDVCVVHHFVWGKIWIPGLSTLGFNYCQWAARWDFELFENEILK